MSSEAEFCLVDDLDEKSHHISNLLTRKCGRTMCYANLQLVDGVIEGNVSICGRWRTATSEGSTDVINSVIDSNMFEY